MLIWVDPGFIRVDLLDRGERCLYDRGSPRWSRPVWQGGCASCTQRRLRTGRVPVPWRQTMGEANENSQLELLDTIGRIQNWEFSWTYYWTKLETCICRKGNYDH